MARRSLPTLPVPVVRTCVGCRVRAAKSDLLRVVSRDGSVVPDPRAQLPGRGAYLHLSRECFEQAERRRSFPRALRLPGPLATGPLGEFLAQMCGEPGAGLPGPARAPSGTAVTATAAPGKQDPIVMSA